MKWTNKRPKKAGYYWIRDAEGYEPEMVELDWNSYHGELTIVWFHQMEDTFALLSEVAEGVQWAGPITPPIEKGNFGT